MSNKTSARVEAFYRNGLNGNLKELRDILNNVANASGMDMELFSVLSGSEVDSALSMANAFAFIGNTEIDLVISKAYYLKSNLEIPENVNLIFKRGGQFVVEDNAVLTINSGSSINADNEQIIFNYNGGSVLLKSFKEVYINWFSGDDVGERITNCKNALNLSSTANTGTNSRRIVLLGSHEATTSADLTNIRLTGLVIDLSQSVIRVNVRSSEGATLETNRRFFLDMTGSHNLSIHYGRMEGVGIKGNITAFSASDSFTNVTSAAHGLSVGDRVGVYGYNTAITDEISYNGLYTVLSVPDANTFEIDAAFGTDEADGALLVEWHLAPLGAVLQARGNTKQSGVVGPFIPGADTAYDTGDKVYSYSAIYQSAIDNNAVRPSELYSATTNYFKNYTCHIGGLVYKSLVDSNLGNDPASSPSKWEEVAGADPLDWTKVETYPPIDPSSGIQSMEGQIVGDWALAAIYNLMSEENYLKDTLLVQNANPAGLYTWYCGRGQKVGDQVESNFMWINNPIRSTDTDAYYIEFVSSEGQNVFGARFIGNSQHLVYINGFDRVKMRRNFCAGGRISNVVLDSSIDEVVEFNLEEYYPHPNGTTKANYGFHIISDEPIRRIRFSSINSHVRLYEVYAEGDGAISDFEIDGFAFEDFYFAPDVQLVSPFFRPRTTSTTFRIVLPGEVDGGMLLVNGPDTLDFTSNTVFSAMVICSDGQILIGTQNRIRLPHNRAVAALTVPDDAGVAKAGIWTASATGELGIINAAGREVFRTAGDADYGYLYFLASRNWFKLKAAYEALSIPNGGNIQIMDGSDSGFEEGDVIAVSRNATIGSEKHVILLDRLAARQVALTNAPNLRTIDAATATDSEKLDFLLTIVKDLTDRGVLPS